MVILINTNTPFILEKCAKQCYVLTTGFLYGEHIRIGCVYAPNVYQGEFYSKLLADISAMSSAVSVIAGDFNCVMDPEVDRSPPAGTTPSKMREATMAVCSDLQLFDTWRVLHPGERDYTFFSNSHRSFSQIDYVFVSRKVLDRIKNCAIGTRLLSDHADIHIIVSSPSPQPSLSHWRLNPLLINSPSFVTFMKEQIELFLSTNDNEDPNPSILWTCLRLT